MLCVPIFAMSTYPSPPAYQSSSGMHRVYQASLNPACATAATFRVYDAGSSPCVEVSPMEPAIGGTHLKRASSSMSSLRDAASSPPAYDDQHMNQDGCVSPVCVSRSIAAGYNFTNCSGNDNNGRQAEHDAALQNAFSIPARSTIPASSVKRFDVSAVGHVPHMYYNAHYGVLGPGSPTNHPAATMQLPQPPTFTSGSSVSRNNNNDNNHNNNDDHIYGTNSSATSFADAIMHKNVSTMSSMHLSSMGKFGVANAQRTQTVNGETSPRIDCGQVLAPAMYSTIRGHVYDNSDDMLVCPVFDTTTATDTNTTAHTDDDEDCSVGRQTSPLVLKGAHDDHSTYVDATKLVSSAVGTVEQKNGSRDTAQTLAMESFLYPSLTQAAVVDPPIPGSTSICQPQQQQQQPQQVDLSLCASRAPKRLPATNGDGDDIDTDESRRMSFQIHQLAVGSSSHNNNNHNSEESSLAYAFLTSPMRNTTHYLTPCATSTVTRSGEDTRLEPNVAHVTSLDTDALLPQPLLSRHASSESSATHGAVHDKPGTQQESDPSLSAHCRHRARATYGNSTIDENMSTHSNSNNNSTAINSAHFLSNVHLSSGHRGVGSHDASMTAAAGAMVDTRLTPSSSSAASSEPHTCSVGKSSTSPSALPATEPAVDVYDPEFKGLLSIPESQIMHRPHPSFGVSRYVLCRNFTLEKGATSCSKGEMCKFVHADTRGATRCSIHVNYVWRSLELCTYPRLPAGDVLIVFAPNERQPSETIRSERVLVTRGSMDWKEHSTPLSHCAHYYFNRMCNRGERCNFIHTVHVDPMVQSNFKRAPAPTAVAPILMDKPGHAVPLSPISPDLSHPHSHHRASSLQSGNHVFSAPHTPTPDSRLATPNAAHTAYLSSSFLGNATILPPHAPVPRTHASSPSSACLHQQQQQQQIPVAAAACFPVPNKCGASSMHTSHFIISSSSSTGSNNYMPGVLANPRTGATIMMPATAQAVSSPSSSSLARECVSPYVMLVNNATGSEAATISVFPVSATVPMNACTGNHGSDNATTSVGAAGVNTMLAPFAVMPTPGNTMPTAKAAVANPTLSLATGCMQTTTAGGGVYHNDGMSGRHGVAGSGMALLDAVTTTATTTACVDSALAMTSPLTAPCSNSTVVSPRPGYSTLQAPYLSGGCASGNVYLTVPPSALTGISSSSFTASPVGKFSRSVSTQSMNELDWSFYSNLDNSAWQNNTGEAQNSSS